MKTWLIQITSWFVRFFTNEPPPFPAGVCGHELAKSVDELHSSGYAKEHNKHERYKSECRKIKRMKWFVLRELAIPNDLRCDMVNPLIVRRYALLTTPFPPIVFDEVGGLLDGLQRLHAARARGDKTIYAYVPEDFRCPPRLS